MEEDNLLGSYDTSFFQMKLKKDCVDFKSGRILNFSVFVHEYIHYLQDITTTYGLNKLCVWSEYLKYAVNKAYNDGCVKVPCRVLGNLFNIPLNQILIDATNGFEKDISNVFVKNVIKENIDIPGEFSKAMKGQNLYKIVLELCDGTKIQFGTRAIVESMAYLMESFFPKHITSPDYPYGCAYIVANHICPLFTIDKLNVMALCDTALLFSNPAEYFYDFMCKVRDGNIVVDRPEVVYDYAYKRMNWKCFFEIFNHVKKTLKGYLNNNPYCASYNENIDSLFGNVIEYRCKNPYFMLKIVRNIDKDGVSSVLKFVANDFRSPLMHNEEGEEFTFGNDDFCMFMKTLKQIIGLFDNGQDICEMYDWCSKSPNVEVDDYFCLNSPWRMCEKAKLCPYAFLWKSWKLEGYDVEIQ